MFWLGLRVALGGVFAYAGVLKVMDPLAFADSIASFRLVPEPLITAMALGLPMFEIALGGLLIANRLTRAAALGVFLLSVVFAIAIGTALARGLTIDCGCFGKSAWSSNGWWLLGRDALLGAASGLVYRHAKQT